ncbi:MAG: hypothetical protein ACREGR_04705, partial [Minisyncoccia bacterium]
IWESDEGVWSKDTETTRGGSMDNTQEYIESLIGMSYKTFVNLTVFSDDNTMSFLEVDTPTKREIVENLLSLEKYRTYFENAKTLRNTAKTQIKILSTEYSRSLSDGEAARFRVSSMKGKEEGWRVAKQQEYDTLVSNLAAKQAMLGKTDFSAELAEYNKAQESIVEFEEANQALVEKRAEAETNLATYQTHHREMAEVFDKWSSKRVLKQAEVTACQAKVDQAQEILDSLKLSAGTGESSKCPLCLQQVSEENAGHIKEEAARIITVETGNLVNLKTTLGELQTKQDKAQTAVKRYNQAIEETRSLLTKMDKSIAINNKELHRLNQIKEPQPDA